MGEGKGGLRICEESDETRGEEGLVSECEWEIEFLKELRYERGGRELGRSVRLNGIWTGHEIVQGCERERGSVAA